MVLMKRFVPAVTVSCALALALGLLSACGDAKTSDHRPTIGFLSQNTGRDFSKEMSEGFRAGAQTSGGVEALVTGPPTHDGLAQVELFKELTPKAKDGIAVSAAAPELLARPMAEVVDSGTPVIAVAGGQIAPGAGVKLLIENDNYELGQLLADEVIGRLPPNGTGKVILGSNSPAQPALDQRATGMRDRFTQRLPSMRVMGPFDTQRDAPANQVAWQRLVVANPDAVAFLGTGDVDAVNLAAVHATGGTWLAGGFSLDPQALRGVKDGHLVATVSGEHYLKGAVAGWLLAEHAKDARQLPEGWFVTRGLVVTSSNVDAITGRQSSEANKLGWFKPQIDTLTANLDQSLRPLDQVR